MAPDALSLAGKVAIVTGSGPFALGRNGASVAVNHVSVSSAGRAAKVADKTKSAGGGRVTVVQADLETPEGAKKLVADTLAAFGTDKVDILVNAAGSGVGHGVGIVGLTPEQLLKSFAGNFFTTFFASQAAIAHMADGGRIVNIGSNATRIPLPACSAYGAAKAAQEHFTHSLAIELGKTKGITVNTVAPGPTSTDLLGWYKEGPSRDVAGKTLFDAIKLEAKLAEPEEVADTVLLLVSEQARWITGQYVAASGGAS